MRFAAFGLAAAVAPRLVRIAVPSMIARLGTDGKLELVNQSNRELNAPIGA